VKGKYFAVRNLCDL